MSIPTRSWTLDAVPAVTAAAAAVSAAAPTGARRIGPQIQLLASQREVWLLGAGIGLGAVLATATFLTLPVLAHSFQTSSRPRMSVDDDALSDVRAGGAEFTGISAGSASAGDARGSQSRSNSFADSSIGSWLSSWFRLLWPTAPRAPSPPPYLLLVRLRLRPGKRAAFLALWAPFAQRVRATEGSGCCAHGSGGSIVSVGGGGGEGSCGDSPVTLSYIAATPESGDPDELLLVQRYASRAALANGHQKSPEFLAFGRALLKADIVLEKTGEGFFELPQDEELLPPGAAAGYCGSGDSVGACGGGSS